MCTTMKGKYAEEALRRLRETLPEEKPQEIGKGKAGPGRGKTGDNITRLPERGTSETYLLRRLKRDAPVLAERVVSALYLIA
jgi:hypothetical protein